MTTITCMSTLRTVALTTCGLALGGAGVAAAVVWSGIYPVSANREHFQFVHAILESTMRHSVQLYARNVQVPDLSSPLLAAHGATCYRQHCAQCHGAPGVAPDPIGRGMQPLPGPIVAVHQRWHPREIYWITKNGIRMSGMPAWQFRLAETDLWALVAFIGKLPHMSPADYAAAAVGSGFAQNPARGVGPDPACGLSAAQLDAVPQRAPDPARGLTALSQYACSTCHQIPGVTGSSPQVGPPLESLATRSLIAGKLANTPENMVRWLRHPQQVDALTAMPDLEVTEADGRDIAAYLATLR